MSHLRPLPFLGTVCSGKEGAAPLSRGVLHCFFLSVYGLNVVHGSRMLFHKHEFVLVLCKAPCPGVRVTLRCIRPTKAPGSPAGAAPLDTTQKPRPRPDLHPRTKTSAPATRTQQGMDVDIRSGHRQSRVQARGGGTALQPPP